MLWQEGLLTILIEMLTHAGTHLTEGDTKKGRGMVLPKIRKSHIVPSGTQCSLNEVVGTSGKNSTLRDWKDSAGQGFA